MSRARYSLAALAALAALTAVGTADAFVPISVGHWNPASLPIAYRTNSGSIPAYLDRAMTLAAINAGFSAWTAPACTNWRVSNVGDTTATRSNRDGVNAVYFQSGSWPSDLGDPGVTLGVTMQVYTGGGGRVATSDADMVLNNVGFRWGFDGRGGNPDLQSIVTHESGHFLGLDHPPIPAAIMYASYSGGIKRTLTTDDINGVCTLYPSGVTPPADAGVATDSCNANAGCDTCTPTAGCGWCGATSRCVTGNAGGTGPASGACASGWAWEPAECTATPGTGAVGTTCLRPTDCAGGYCVATMTGATMGICTQTCTDDCGCPDGFQCFATSMAGLRVCGPGTRMCNTAMPDAGTPVRPDASTPVTPDAGDPVTTPDSSTPPGPDAGLHDAARAADGSTGTESNPGCGCTTPGRSSHTAPWALLAISVATVFAARRRRRA